MKNCNNTILIIATEFPPGPGGIGSHAYSLAMAFVRKGYNTSVIASGDFADKEAIASFDNEQPFRIIRYQNNINGVYWRRLKLVSNFLKKKIVTNIILSGKFSLWIGLYLKLTGIKVPTLAILHGSEINLSNSILRLLTHLSIYKCNQIAAVSEFSKTLVPKWIRKRKKIVVIPNGIDVNMLNQFPGHKLTLRGNPVILTVGNVSPRKGQHQVIKALPSILDEFPDIHYHIVGRPTHQKEFERLAKSLNVESHITFHGKIATFEELSHFYKSADLFIILSENQLNGDVEGFGIVVLEANYYGLPVVGAIGCGIADAINPGKNGYLVEGNNPADVCKAVKLSLANKTQMDISAKEWALQHDWDMIISQFIKLLS